MCTASWALGNWPRAKHTRKGAMNRGSSSGQWPPGSNTDTVVLHLLEATMRKEKKHHDIPMRVFAVVLTHFLIDYFEDMGFHRRFRGLHSTRPPGNHISSTLHLHFTLPAPIGYYLSPGRFSPSLTHIIYDDIIFCNIHFSPRTPPFLDWSDGG